MSLARLKTRLHPYVPVLTVVGTLATTSGFFFADDHRRAVLGYAQGLPEAVASLEAARVTSVNVAVGDRVDPGQVLATLDTSLVDAEIAIAEADKVRLEAEIRAERALVDRRLDVDVASLERETLYQREEQLRLDAETKALDAEIARVRALVVEHQAVASDLTQLELRRASSAALAAQKPRTLDTIAKQMNAASKRRDETGGAGAHTTAKLEADLLVVRRQIELLDHRRDALTLRATRPGRVASIERRSGEIAAAGEPIVNVVSATDRVIACVPERASLGLRETDTARLWVKGQRGAPFRGHTVALGPVVSELPTRCWTAPHVPMWGREVTIALDTPVDVVAGESFEIALDASPSPAASAATTTIASAALPPRPAATSAPEPRRMIVPPALTSKSRFEPSGLVTLRSEQKYLVVSDDTGWHGRDEGKPWLFAMDATGAVAPEPITIAGVSEIDDLESIARSDAGDVWVLSSQGFNKKGKRKPARTSMLHLRRDGGGYRADAEAHLGERFERLLGLAPGQRDLDVEGMTFKDGALYVGVKAPVDANGDARIVEIGAPRAFLEGDDSSASVWATVHLEVDVDGARVAGGISELAFSPSGALVLASTPSTADSEASALFVVAAPVTGGRLTPNLVRRFPRHKAEGLAPSLTTNGLVVVFDAGQRTPSLLELPWPER